MTTIDNDLILLPPADVSGISRKWLDIPYANCSNAEMLDIYLPEAGEGPFPIVLYIHGGAFQQGDKRDIELLTFLKALSYGYAVIGVNYRLSGEAIFPAALQDIKAAIRWIRANSEKFQLDGNRIAVWGSSAGGNFTSMICVTSSVTEFDDYNLGNPGYPCNVQAAVDWFGPTDFLMMDEQLLENALGPADHGEANSPESRYLGAKISDVPLKVELANPMTYIHKNMPPILIQHGSMDSTVPVQQSIIFVEKMQKYISHDRFEFDVLEGAGHGGPAFESTENIKRVMNFLDKHLK